MCGFSTREDEAPGRFHRTKCRAGCTDKLAAWEVVPLRTGVWAEQRVSVRERNISMDIFKFAMDKEKFSELYYRDLADRTPYPGLKNILNMLADEEVKHYQTVEQMKAGVTEEMADTPVLANAQEIFEKMRESATKFDFHISEADLYAKAAKIEEESKQYYLQKAQEVKDPAQQRILRKLADEEHKHWLIVDRLRSFVSRPETFLENAEIYHFNDYVGGQF